MEFISFDHFPIHITPKVHIYEINVPVTTHFVILVIQPGFFGLKMIYHGRMKLMSIPIQLMEFLYSTCMPCYITCTRYGSQNAKPIKMQTFNLTAADLYNMY